MNQMEITLSNYLIYVFHDDKYWWLLSTIVLIQAALLIAGAFKSVRQSKYYVAALIVSIAHIEILYWLSVYFAMQPPA